MVTLNGISMQSVQVSLFSAARDLRVATANLVTAGLTVEAQQALDILQKLEGLERSPRIASGLIGKELELAKGGDRIGAIKEHRTRTGAKLEEARVLVDAFISSNKGETTRR